MPREFIHLSDLLGLLRRYATDQESNLDTQLWDRIPALLKDSGELPAPTIKFLNEALASGKSPENVLNSVELRAKIPQTLIAKARQKARDYMAMEEAQKITNEAFVRDYFRPSIWQYAAHEVLKRSTIPIHIDDLGECVGLIRLCALPKSTPASQLIASLHDNGLTFQLLSELRSKYPLECRQLGIHKRQTLRKPAPSIPQRPQKSKA